MYVLLEDSFNVIRNAASHAMMMEEVMVSSWKLKMRHLGIRICERGDVVKRGQICGLTGKIRKTGASTRG